MPSYSDAWHTVKRKELIAPNFAKNQLVQKQLSAVVHASLSPESWSNGNSASMQMDQHTDIDMFASSAKLLHGLTIKLSALLPGRTLLLRHSLLLYCSPNILDEVTDRV